MRKIRNWLLSISAVLLAVSQLGAFSGAGGIWYHAKGAFISSPADGSNTGMQSAVNAANNGGFVFVHAGRYRIDSGTIAVGNGVTIEGVGDSTVFEIATNDTAFNIWGNGVTLRNLRIEGKKWNHSASQGIVITGDSVTVENVTINDTYDAAIHLHTGAHSVKVVGCRINRPGGAASTDGRGVVIHDANDAVVSDTEVYGAKTQGFWVQGTSERTKLLNCKSIGATGDNVLVDATAKHTEILGGTFNGSTAGDGIECNADSSNVGLNTIIGNRVFGLWAVNGGDGSSWWTNNIYENGNYNIAIESSDGTAHAGYTVVGNFLINARGPNAEFQASGGGSILRDVMFASNYVIKNSPSLGGGGSFSAVKVVTGVAGTTDRVHIKGNVIKLSVKDGIEVAASGAGKSTNMVISNNDITDNTGYAINLTDGGAGSSAHLSGNIARNNTLGNEPLRTASGWTYEGVFKERLQASVSVLEDSLRVNGISSLWGTANVYDSLHVHEALEVGMRDLSGPVDTLRVGREMAFKKYGSTGDYILHNTGNGIEVTNNGTNFLRASDAAGSWSFQTGGSTARLTIASDGDINVQSNFQFRLSTSSQAALPAHDNGSLIYCSDCDRGTVPCATGGGPDGVIARRENGAWNCD